MRRAQDVLFDVAGQSLTVDIPEGRPSSVTSVSVFAWDVSDESEAEDATSGSASINSVNTTLSAAAGVGQSDLRALTLTSGTGVTPGERYIITSAAGLREIVDVQSANGTAVVLRAPLINAYASGSTFQSASVSISLDDAWCADVNNLSDAGSGDAYRVRWVYVVGGATHILDTYFSLVRYAGKHDVTPMDVEAALPGWLDSLPTDHRDTQGRRLIDEAHQAVQLDLLGVDVDDASIASGDAMDNLVRRKAIHLSELAKFIGGGGVDRSRLDAAESHYQRLLDNVVRVVANAKRRDTDGAAKSVVAKPLTVR